MVKYKAYLFVIILITTGTIAAFLGLNHWVRGQIDIQATSSLEGAGNRLVSQFRIKAFKMIQDLSRHQNDERLLSALKKLPFATTSDMSVEDARNALERCHQEATPILEDIQQKIKMTTNLVLLASDGTVIARLPEKQRFGDSMKGLPAVAECTQGVSRDGLYEIDGKPQLTAVTPVQNQKGNVAACLMSFNQLGETEVQALKQVSGLDVAMFLRKKLVASTLKPQTADQLTSLLDSREIIYFGNPESAQPPFVDYNGKAYAARTMRLPSGTDMFHLVAIYSSTHFIAIHQKTQYVLLIGCGALLIFGLLLCFILSGPLRNNEAERLRDAVGMLVNGSSSGIAVDNYSGTHREIALHIAHMAGSDTKSTTMTSSDPISDLLGPYPKSSPTPVSSETISPQRNILDFENLLGKERANQQPVLPIEPKVATTGGDLPDFAAEPESQPGFDLHPASSQVGFADFEPEATVVSPAHEQLIKASSQSDFQSFDNQPATEAYPDPHSTPTDFEEAEFGIEPNSAEAHYREVFDKFISTKKQCGESTAGLTCERFSDKLRINESDLKTRYKCSSVKFQVYVKNGKAALKASPIK